MEKEKSRHDGGGGVKSGKLGVLRRAWTDDGGFGSLRRPLMAAQAWEKMGSASGELRRAPASSGELGRAAVTRWPAKGGARAREEATR